MSNNQTSKAKHLMRADYLIQILDKIGGPLVAGLAGAPMAPDSESDDTKAQAQAVAELLARAVQMSIEMGKAMELEASDQETSDKYRLALMALAGPIIAGQFRVQGRVPGDAEQKKIMDALEAVLTFSGNFAPSEANTAQLAALEQAPVAGDDATLHLYSLNALAPVVSAVALFSFGQPEKKLVQEAAGKILETARNLCSSFDIEEAQTRQAELTLVKTLAEIYAQAHETEMKRMEEPGYEGGLENVWKAFEIRAAMLQTLAANLLPGGMSETGSGESSVAPAQDQAPAEAQPATPPVPSEPVAPPPVQSEPPAAPPPGGFNPMSGFAKKQSDADDNGESAPSPAAPPAPPPAPPSQDTPPPAQSEDKGDSGDAGGGPMSFFKKKE